MTTSTPADPPWLVDLVNASARAAGLSEPLPATSVEPANPYTRGSSEREAFERGRRFQRTGNPYIESSSEWAAFRHGQRVERQSAEPHLAAHNAEPSVAPTAGQEPPNRATVLGFEGGLVRGAWHRRDNPRIDTPRRWFSTYINGDRPHTWAEAVEYGASWAHVLHTSPTQDAYDAACRALETHRKRADDAEAELAKLREQRDRALRLCDEHEQGAQPAPEWVRRLVRDALDGSQ